MGSAETKLCLQGKALPKKSVSDLASQTPNLFVFAFLFFFELTSSDKSALSKAGSGAVGHPFPLANLVFHIP